MTESYGTDHKDHETGAEHEHDAAETLASTYQGDQPPVDDFADHSSEESATVMEETESGEGSEEGSASGTPPRKRSSVVLPIIASLGGVLFLGAMLYMQFGRPSTPAVSNQPPALPTSASAPVIPTAPTDAANTNVAPTTAMAPVADNTATSPTAGSALPTSAADAGAPLVPPGAAPAPTPAPVPMPVPSAPASVASMAPTSAPAPVPSMPPSLSPVNPVPVTAVPANADVDGRLTALSARVEDLQRSLAQATQQLTQVSTMVATAPASSSSNPVVDERIAKLEQQIAQLEQHPSSTSASAAPTSSSRKSSHHHATHSTTHHASKHKKSKKSSSHKTASHHKGKTTSVASASSSSGAPWVLRAASQDEAYVSRTSSSADLLPIHVGDDVAGIGQVRSIQQDGDRWVVIGSHGTIQ